MTITTVYEIIYVLLFSSYTFLLYNTHVRLSKQLENTVATTYGFIQQQTTRTPFTLPTKMLHSAEYSNAAALYRNTTPERLVEKLQHLTKATLVTQVLFSLLAILLASILLHHVNPFQDWVYILANILMTGMTLYSFKTWRALKKDPNLALRLKGMYHLSVDKNVNDAFLLLGTTYLFEAVHALQRPMPSPSNAAAVESIKHHTRLALKVPVSAQSLISYCKSLRNCSVEESLLIDELLEEYQELLSALILTECMLSLYSDKLSEDSYTSHYANLIEELSDENNTHPSGTYSE